jgi:alpha-D-ribose 1-methylphosphonate 5-triphosphate synthase subunit PhnH
VRLSKDTVNDKSLPIWLSNQLKASKVEPARLCFQVGQEVADYKSTPERIMEDLVSANYGAFMDYFDDIMKEVKNR